MPMSNLERMIALADEFFQAKNDPEQIHPDTLKEETDENGKKNRRFLT